MTLSCILTIVSFPTPSMLLAVKRIVQAYTVKKISDNVCGRRGVVGNTLAFGSICHRIRALLISHHIAPALSKLR